MSEKVYEARGRFSNAFGAVQPKRELFFTVKGNALLNKFTEQVFKGLYLLVFSSKIIPFKRESPQIAKFCIIDSFIMPHSNLDNKRIPHIYELDIKHLKKNR